MNGKETHQEGRCSQWDSFDYEAALALLDEDKEEKKAQDALYGKYESFLREAIPKGKS
jgi:hypothetical protein